MTCAPKIPRKPVPSEVDLKAARSLWLVFLATGMTPLAATKPAACGDPVVAAALAMEAIRGLLRLVEIPAGSFLMGSPRTERGRSANEGPQHQVTIRRPFLMGAVPVMRAAWQEIMGFSSSMFPDDAPDDFPVASVSWDDLFGFPGFFHLLNSVTEGARPLGSKFRLPSEAEWEYGCRAGTTSRWCFGTEPGPMRDYAKVDPGPVWQNADPVGCRKPNTFGLFDLHGNVCEWCQDVWHPDYVGAPTNGRPWQMGGDKDFRVARGASWLAAPKERRSAYRIRFHRTQVDDALGFRVVCR